MPNDLVDRSSQRSSACYPRRTFCPLSDGSSTRDPRITRSDNQAKMLGHLCSACLPCSQGGIYPCAPKVGYLLGAPLRAPPLLFWRRPPQSNWQPSSVPNWVRERMRRRVVFHGRFMLLKSATCSKLPPTLHTASSISLEGSSKGAQGLSV